MILARQFALSAAALVVLVACSTSAQAQLRPGTVPPIPKKWTAAVTIQNNTKIAIVYSIRWGKAGSSTRITLAPGETQTSRKNFLAGQPEPNPTVSFNGGAAGLVTQKLNAGNGLKANHTGKVYSFDINPSNVGRPVLSLTKE